MSRGVANPSSCGSTHLYINPSNDCARETALAIYLPLSPADSQTPHHKLNTSSPHSSIHVTHMLLYTGERNPSPPPPGAAHIKCSQLQDILCPTTLYLLPLLLSEKRPVFETSHQSFFCHRRNTRSLKATLPFLSCVGERNYCYLWVICEMDVRYLG